MESSQLCFQTWWRKERCLVLIEFARNEFRAPVEETGVCLVLIKFARNEFRAPVEETRVCLVLAGFARNELRAPVEESTTLFAAAHFLFAHGFDGCFVE